MASYRIISSDNHVVEPPDLWTSRVESRFKDRAPRIVREESGGDFWKCDGKTIMPVAAGTQAGVRFEEPEKLSLDATQENVPLGGYVPEEHVKDIAIDGMDAGILYPTTGLLLFSVPDSELTSAIFGAYNDWLAEFCKPFPRQLKGIAMVNVDDVQEGIKELERCANMGLIGAMITVYPPEGRGYHLPEYEPLWAASQDLDMPLSLHAATNRGEEFSSGAGGLSTLINMDHWVRMSLSGMTLSGVFERYPRLRIGAIEHELAWIPHFLDRIDYAYSQRVPMGDSHRFGEDMLPSDYIHRNVFYGFQEDALGIRDRHIIGVDSLMWGADYPHIESTFPRSQQILEEILVDCTEEEKAKIAGGNAARIYHID